MRHLESASSGGSRKMWRVAMSWPAAITAPSADCRFDCRPCSRIIAPPTIFTSCACPEGAPTRHRRVFDELRQRGIHVNLHYLPVHLQPYYRRLGFEPGQYPQAEAHGIGAITLPLFAALSEEDQDRVVDAVSKTLIS